MKTIITGTDFTPSSINACRYAAFLAEKLNCKLTIFNMFEAPIIHSNMGLFGISYTTQRKVSENKAAKLISDLQKLFPKIKINELVTSGSFKNELENFTNAHQVELMVMGLAAKDRISKFIYGSRGVNIAGKINCPVVIVPEKYTKHKLSTVLLAVDNNEKLYKSSLKGFEKFLQKSKAKLNLLHIRTENEVFDPVMKTIKINGEKLPISVINARDMQDGMKKCCAPGKVDLVTIISKEHSVFYNLFVESNTKKVAFVAKVPVMAIHE
ncbi:MAG: universal stress protein [Bacteroidota bacterium]|nr:universal stress protein [Bacteroidota bacterium]MDP3145857.1 universal stress protein [Bacteroidota bacterium]